MIVVTYNRKPRSCGNSFVLHSYNVQSEETTFSLLQNFSQKGLQINNIYRYITSTYIKPIAQG